MPIDPIVMAIDAAKSRRPYSDEKEFVIGSLPVSKTTLLRHSSI